MSKKEKISAEETTERKRKRKKSRPKKKSRKPIFITFAIIAVLVIVAGIFLANSGGRAYDRKIDSGYDYINRHNYEKAVEAFDKAIEIDPGRTEGYMGKAEAMARDKEMTPEKAMKIVSVLDLGYKSTKDKKVLYYKKVIGEIIRENGFEEESRLVDITGSEEDSASVFTEDEEWKNAYKKVLKETSYSEYTLYDIDKDEIPELIFNDYGGRYTCKCYGYKDGSIVDYGTFETETLYKYNGNGVLITTDGTGVSIVDILKIEDGKLVEAEGDYLYSVVPVNSDVRTYEYMGEAIEEEAFYAKWDELVKNIIDVFHKKSDTTPITNWMPEIIEEEEKTAQEETEAMLTEYYWEHFGLEYCVLEFRGDGTGGIIYPEAMLFYDKTGFYGTLEKNDFYEHSFEYEVDDNGGVTIDIKDGLNLSLDCVDMTADIAWDEAVVEKLPAADSFFYESDYVKGSREKDEAWFMVNTFYKRK